MTIRPDAGVVLGRLWIPVVGVVLIVFGPRRRRDPSRNSHGTVLIVVGAVLLVVGMFGALLVMANAVGTSVQPAPGSSHESALLGAGEQLVHPVDCALPGGRRVATLAGPARQQRQ